MESKYVSVMEVYPNENEKTKAFSNVVSKVKLLKQMGSCPEKLFPERSNMLNVCTEHS